ncbi:hypothetical protein TNCV_5034171 [Trichonephila clavipes]|nr:hypothetical protein TNCV_5034171 [Trichonephila clavipes]
MVRGDLEGKVRAVKYEDRETWIESPGWRELEESPKEKRLGRWRTEIGVERKERRRTPVALENWNEWFKDMSECPSEKGLNSRDID